ncbi:MAG: 2'-5' RNA ligase family protein [Chloroflexota bacterium]|nr:2'-5' RNA ligase family protein [Chloroflexota bacterium]
MHGIVSLLDERHEKEVENLWAELAERFDIHGIYQTPFPHFSYQVAESYDLDALEAVLERFASNAGGFNISASGLGVFTGPGPVLYVPVVRTRELARLHRLLWPELSEVATGTSDYYHPRNWMPHITLANNDLTPEKLAVAAGWLGDRNLNWEIPINNLALIHDTGDVHELKFIFEW